MSLIDKKSIVSGAPITMHELGKTTDSAVLKEIIVNPGSSVSAIAENLKWSNGKVDGSINRLLTERKVIVRYFLQRGTLLKRVYPNTFIEKPKNIVEIPHELIRTDIWANDAFVYALSRSTIGIAPKENEEWSNKALVKGLADLKKDKDSVMVTFPENFSDFYEFQNSETSLSTVGDIAMVTVESVLPVRLPATYSERTKQSMITYKLEMEEEQLTQSQEDFFIYSRKKISAKVTFPCYAYSDLKKTNDRIMTVTNADTQPIKETFELSSVMK